MVDKRSSVRVFAVGVTRQTLLTKETYVNPCNMKTIELSSRRERPTSGLKRVGSTWRPFVGLALLALVGWRCGGGGGSSCSPGADVQGVWTGPVTSDDVARGNPGTVTASITQSDCTFGGTWRFTFEDPNLNNLFEILDGSASTSQVDLAMFECTGAANSCATVSTCSYQVTATLVSPTEMTGSYVAGDICASFNQGTFDITLLNRFTPTPAAILTPTPPSTPSA